MVKFAEEVSDDNLLAYCVAFGIIFGMLLGSFTGVILGNSFIMVMGPAIGIFIGLAAWFILSE